MRADVIHLHPLAPAKPATGQPCNGCGACCAWRPCPLGVLLSGRLRGPCRALRWDAPARRYRCSALAPPGPPPSRSPWRQRLVGRWIAAGQGCDASLQVEPAGPSG